MSIYQFGSFELDESRRELRLRGREIALQPRVFDLLCYLTSNRDRVVSKDELLESLWPGIVVTEGSLQRAISLLRAALRQGGLTDAIRTFSRTGYRFCADIIELEQDPQAAEVPPPLQVARQLYEQGNWEEAIEAFQLADTETALEGPDLERWADAIQYTGQTGSAVGPLERAVTAHTVQGDSYGAARAMLNLAMVKFEQREMAVAKGLHQRAFHLLPENEPSRERGILMWQGSKFAAVEGDLETAEDHARQALEIGRVLADTDLEILGLNYLGLALQAKGKFKEGAALQDEAAAAVLAGEVSPLPGGIVYCSVIWGCRNRGDWERATQWTNEFIRWCKNSPLHDFPGTCRLHRAEVLSIQGRLDEAEGEARAMCASLALRAPWAEGNAYQVLGDIYQLRGEPDQAEAAFRRAYELGWDPQPGLAMLKLAAGEPAAARQMLEQSLADNKWANRQRRGALLSSYVRVCLADNDSGQARTAMAELHASPELYVSDAHKGMMMHAQAELALHRGDTQIAIDDLRQAISAWNKAGSPLHTAIVRLRLAEILIEAGIVHSGDLELQSARNCFRIAGARALLQQCESLLRQL